MFYVISDDVIWCYDDVMMTLGQNVVFVGSRLADEHGVLPFSSTLQIGKVLKVRLGMVRLVKVRLIKVRLVKVRLG